MPRRAQSAIRLLHTSTDQSGASPRAAIDASVPALGQPTRQQPTDEAAEIGEREEASDGGRVFLSRRIHRSHIEPTADLGVSGVIRLDDAGNYSFARDGNGEIGIERGAVADHAPGASAGYLRHLDHVRQPGAPELSGHSPAADGREDEPDWNESLLAVTAANVRAQRRRRRVEPAAGDSEHSRQSSPPSLLRPDRSVRVDRRDGAAVRQDPRPQPPVLPVELRS